MASKPLDVEVLKKVIPEGTAITIWAGSCSYTGTLLGITPFAVLLQRLGRENGGSYIYFINPVFITSIDYFIKDSDVSHIRESLELLSNKQT